MKILFVSMNSIHFQRWAEQLKDSGHEIHWFNIRDGVMVKQLSWVNQIIGWQQKYPKFKGRHFIKKHLPKLYNRLRVFFEHKTSKVFEEKLLEINPDVVHSFALYVSCWPIVEVMQKHYNIPWIYSSWGSDLYYFQNKTKYLKQIKTVLPRIDFMFADCLRDKIIAEKYGFKGKFLGVFPGGGGYDLDTYSDLVMPLKDRNLILIKGYQGRSGRAIQVLKAIELISDRIISYKVIVFGADKDVKDVVDRSLVLKHSLNIEVLPITHFLPHSEIMKLMGSALLYVGNSNSDGIPNTLLEAIIMGAFPIQSNPGGATAEILKHETNGLLIRDFNNSNEIAALINKALSNTALIKSAFRINQSETKYKFDRNIIADEVKRMYSLVGKS